MMNVRWGVLLACIVWSSATAAQDYRCNRERAQIEVRELTDRGIILSVSEFPPNVSVVVDGRRWAKSDDEVRKRWAQEVECATGAPYADMLRTVTFRAKDTSLLGSYSGSDLKK